MFNSTYKYENQKFKEFKSFEGNVLCSYEYIESLVFVYSEGVHIATYNTKTQILDTDQVDLFLK